VSATTVCPHCGTATPFPREPDPELGGVSFEEFEVLVRNEWRQRLGSQAYERVHSRRLIRAVAVLALEPWSPIRTLIVERLLWQELVRWGEAGLCRADVERELDELGAALGHQLRITRGNTDTTRQAIARVRARLAAVLQQPTKEVEPVLQRDEVCGMEFPEEEAAGTIRMGGKTYYFCSERCRHLFARHPERFVAVTGEQAKKTG